MERKRIVVLGGGFSGIYSALALEKQLRHRDDVVITLVNQENYLLFTPMLHEVAASDLDPNDIVNPIHKLLKRSKIFCGSIDQIDLQGRQIVVSHGDDEHSHRLNYDYLVIALGSVTHFFNLPGLNEHALTMKSLGDALYLRNRMIAHLEEADFECASADRKQLLTFVVAGAGFAGVETVAAINDFLHEVRRFYRNLKATDIRIVLIHSGTVILPELDQRLGQYAGALLAKRGVEIIYNCKVVGFEDNVVSLSRSDIRIPAATLVWTAGNMPNPLLASIGCTTEKGRILVSPSLEVPSYENVWALGDCAAIPDGKGGFYPPTAQHAVREAKVVAKNTVASIDGSQARVSFRFRSLGQLASLGHRKGVAQIFGFRFSGVVAWFLWRTIYLLKLPRVEKRCRVAIDWTLDLFFSKDIVQLPVKRASDMRVPMAVRSTD